jgi:hypothetical protein
VYVTWNVYFFTNGRYGRRRGTVASEQQEGADQPDRDEHAREPGKFHGQS